MLFVFYKRDSALFLEKVIFLCGFHNIFGDIETECNFVNLMKERIVNHVVTN